MTIWPKMVIAFTLGYALSPVDLIPDFIPVLGYLDDLFIVPALLVLSIKLIPTDVLEESKKIANQKPIILKKNRLFAFIFIVIWIIILVIIILYFLKYF
jgi:uncharacterized membrane protein YkvA (DUF1232 family)